MLKKIRDNISIITIGIIILGYCDLYGYYKQFGINIYNYLEPTEIIFAFSSILEALVILSLVMGVGIIFGMSHDRTEPIDKSLPKSDMILEKKKRLKSVWRAFVLLILITSFLFVIIFVFHTIRSIADRELLVIYGLLIVLGIALKEIIIYSNWIKYEDDKGKLVSKERQINLNLYAYVAAVVVAFFINRIFIRYQNIVDGYPKYIVTFDPMKKDFKNQFYVGSTKSYIFFYDSASKSVNAYPERNIESISIKELRDGL